MRARLQDWIKSKLGRRSTDNGSVEHGNPSIIETLPGLPQNVVGTSINPWNTFKSMLVRRGIIGLDSIPEGSNGISAQAESLSRPSLFTSSAFSRLQTPIPVEDIFFDAWILSVQRIFMRSFVIFSYSIWLYNIHYTVLILICIFAIRYGLLRLGIRTIYGIPIPKKHRLLLALIKWYPKFWEHIASRACLTSGRRSFLTWFWWYIYLLIADGADFKQNYLEAWRQRDERLLHIYIQDNHLHIPIPPTHNDKIVLERIRLFYGMVQVERGLLELLFPKQLERIDCVEMTKDTFILMREVETLQLGRYQGRLVNLFEHPEFGERTSAIADKIHALSRDTIALNFVRKYNIGSISMILAFPPLGSIIFATVWIRVFIYRAGTDIQVMVATAFTVASYIVTAGALIIALVGFLDAKRTQNEEMIDKLSRKSIEPVHIPIPVSITVAATNNGRRPIQLPTGAWT
ncbi:hypothetical protein EPUS_09488 [Endocarpon pusillum Z07020]|uniref:Uncharacterized protein n=1 Tax=Endocarpon pusillum (strain Z07020 / HMAS-L-300199) TaxID=1263415 RepID=U1GFN9_ENDPU|nr:uncharacterized protein EPUS_09488 [Endocarpon pusillum Z07020]ERF70561.1 hypothetical protein EPUS_09488 [Endocarpon pusillum Z07020]